jgi:hypothetical protein
MIFVSWVDTGCDTEKNKIKKTYYYVHTWPFECGGNETVIVPNITLLLYQEIEIAGS